jgi:hypothetical protein
VSTHGPRFTDGGYQAPRTDAAQLTRGRAIREQTWRIGARRVELKIVPLEGGRPELFELELQIDDLLRAHHTYIPCMVRGLELARQAFALTAQELDADRVPDHVHLPPGAPLGW